jgi:hypothetical protein
MMQNRKQSKNRDMNAGQRQQVFNFNTINVVGSPAAPEQIVSPNSAA